MPGFAFAYFSIPSSVSNGTLVRDQQLGTLAISETGAKSVAVSNGSFGRSAGLIVCDGVVIMIEYPSGCDRAVASVATVPPAPGR